MCWCNASPNRLHNCCSCELGFCCGLCLELSLEIIVYTKTVEVGDTAFRNGEILELYMNEQYRLYKRSRNKVGRGVGTIKAHISRAPL